MGIMSWIWGSGGDAGTPKKDNPWRRLYDPGTPPNPRAVEGAGYYDTVKDKAAPSVWDCVLQSEEFRRRSFSDIDKDQDGLISQSELQAAVGPSGPPAAALIRAADREGKGAINRAEFDAVMRTHFGTA